MRKIRTPTNKLILASVISSLLCGGVAANASSYTYTGNTFNSSRDNAKLNAAISVSPPSSNQSIYVWAVVKNLGEFCYSEQTSWIPSIVTQQGGTIASGKAKCNNIAGSIIGDSKNTVTSTVKILDGMNLSGLLFDETHVYVGVGDGSGMPSNGNYKEIYTISGKIPTPTPGSLIAVAKFSYDMNAGVPVTVNLDASESSEPNGSIVKYDWLIQDDAKTLNLTTTGVKSTIKITTPGTYNVFLTVTDNKGQQTKVHGDSQIIASNPRTSKPLGGIATQTGKDLSAIQKILIGHYTDPFTLPQTKVTGGECTHQYQITSAIVLCDTWNTDLFSGHFGECKHTYTSVPATYGCNTWSPVVGHTKVMNCDWYLNIPGITSVSVKSDISTDIQILSNLVDNIKTEVKAAFTTTLAESAVASAAAGFASVGVGAAPTFIATFSAALPVHMGEAMDKIIYNFKNIELLGLKSLPFSPNDVSEACGWSDWS